MSTATSAGTGPQMALVRGAEGERWRDVYAEMACVTKSASADVLETNNMRQGPA